MRAQLKGTKMSKGESIQDYYTRVSEFKEQIESIRHSLDEYQLVMTTLNGLTRRWDSFIQTMCARKEGMKFNIVWEDYVQGEARVAYKKLYSKNMIKP